MAGKQLDPLQKEALILEFREKGGLMHEFCEEHKVPVSSFKRWIKQYESKGIAGLARADKRFESLFPEEGGTVESYKKLIMQLTIENARLKKKYMVRTNEAGEKEFIPLKMKNSK